MTPRVYERGIVHMQGPKLKGLAASLGFPTYLNVAAGPRKSESESETESRCVL